MVLNDLGVSKVENMCATCTHSFEFKFKEKDSEEENVLLFCHRHPPVYVKDLPFAQYPRVEGQGCCGEFKCR